MGLGSVLHSEANEQNLATTFFRCNHGWHIRYLFFADKPAAL
jgi:hypothetical protein